VSASKSNVDSWVLPAIHVATLGRLRSVIALQAQRGLDSKVSVNFCHSDRSSLELQRLSCAGSGAALVKTFLRSKRLETGYLRVCERVAEEGALAVKGDARRKRVKWFNASWSVQQSITGRDPSVRNSWSINTGNKAAILHKLTTLPLHELKTFTHAQIAIKSSNGTLEACRCDVIGSASGQGGSKLPQGARATASAH
jgi:hypothetical protein